MFRNYLKIAFRNLLKNKIYSGINVLGLAIGVSATILILIYIQFELSYDHFHNNARSIYRISIIHKKEGKLEFESPIFTPPIGPAMAKDFPEVEAFVRLSTPRTAYVYHNHRSFKVTEIIFADSSFFDFFSFQLLAGNPKTALGEPYSLVLTESTARRIFGSQSPLGKTVKLDDREIYKITGIVADPPANSHIQFSTLISFETLYKDANNYMDWNGGNQYYTYVTLSQNASAEAIEKKFPDFMWEYINEQYANYGLEMTPYLQPLQDIYLYHNPNSDTRRTNIYIFSAVALLILLIACINFVNLTTARATKRAKEVGVRKVLGANKHNLIQQFMGETLLLSMIAVVFASFLVELFFPIYQKLLNRNFEISSVVDIADIWILFALILLVGVVAGSYPAFYLSSLQAAKTLKNAIGSGLNRGKSRNSLVVLQFAISIALIVCTFVINRQLNFVKSKELGFDKENIVVIPLVSDEIKLKSAILKQELSKIPNVINVAASSDVPRNGFTSNGYIPEGFKNPIMIHVVNVDEDFLATYGLELVQGRNFSREFSTDQSAYLINESLAKLLHWDDPVGKTIRRNGNHQVIAVVKDFHFATLHDKIAPLIITLQPWRNRFHRLSVKISSGDVPQTLSAINRTWKKLAPSLLFEYEFLDEAFDHLYKSEQRFQMFFSYFSILAISIALLGLFSLASFSTEQRIKEIGIRKVLGATVTNVIGLLSKDFVTLVLLANLLAWPVAWYAMNRWLQNFAYRIEISWWVFALAGGLALVIALLTVSTQAVKAALANPVESLRYE